MGKKTNRIENNNVTISGEIVSNFEFSHEVYGEGFYIAQLASERESGTKDIILIMVSERIVDVKSDWIGQFVKISGQFHSYNRHEDRKNRLILSVFAREFEIETPHDEDQNEIFLDGYVCKHPTYRKTPIGREIADILLAINRPYGKSDYIPCIAWGRNARFANTFQVGGRCMIWGRIQSRVYQKNLSDKEYEMRTAYEVSISKLEIVEETEG